jgi:galactose mutarotase-like enzyme
MAMQVLTDVAGGIWVDQVRLSAESFGRQPERGANWSITKKTLHGGRREGVDVVELDNGRLSLVIVPTRGMNLWRGQFGADRLGWDSPVRDGPVNPAFVELGLRGGLGWLDGFDELLARCGLEHNGAPFEENGAVMGLHGRISNIPAHYVAVDVSDDDPGTLAVVGRVDECRLFGPQLRLTTEYRTTPGSNRVTVTDTFENLGDTPCDLQILYHWNLGPPYLGPGSIFRAPMDLVLPRTGDAAACLPTFDHYDAPCPGEPEQVFYFELRAEASSGQTVALLTDPSGSRGVALRFDPRALPCFSLWKSQRLPGDGFVTGLEPGTNYPNPKPFERANGRVPTLAPQEKRVATTVLEVLDTAEAVSALVEEIQAIQGDRPARVLDRPTLPYAPE